MKVSVIATILNEERSIGALLTSLLAQTRKPDEIVLVDGGSRDRTRAVVEEFIDGGAPIVLLVKAGCNISEGRNLAISSASGDVIASTDAGVRLSPQWLEELVKPFEVNDTSGAPFPAGAGPWAVRVGESPPAPDTRHPGPAAEGSPDVVCGFFLPDPQTTFEVAMGATVLPALSDVNPATFLPSSRSVAFRRSAWETVGGYPEWLDYCEDLIFDLDLKRKGFRFVLAPRAIVYFRPRPTLRAFYTQYYRYARGDGKAHLWTKRHVVRYATYLGGCLALIAGFWYKPIWLALLLAAAAYTAQPYRRLIPMLRGRGLTQWLAAIALVPVIRLVGDGAKMVGYPVGLLWRRRRRNDFARSVHRHR